MQEGDVIKVHCVGDYSLLYLHLELKFTDEAAEPLYNYVCPKDSTHTLQLFYSRGGKLDPEYVELRKKYSENGCDHDLRQQKNKDKGYEDPERCIATQYFCNECKLSFCGDCAFRSRKKN